MSIAEKSVPKGERGRLVQDSSRTCHKNWWKSDLNMKSLISTGTPALQYIQLLLMYSFYVIRHTWCYLFNLIYYDPVILFLLTLIFYFNQCFFSGLCVTRRSSASALSGLMKVNELFSLSLKLFSLLLVLVYSTVDTSLILFLHFL